MQDATEYLSRFGLASFRPGQRDVIDAVLAGEDSVCIMPTGGGKSLCYQLPAIMQEGVTLVVSPLIALMKDQVDALQHLGLNAACINSALSPGEQADCIAQMQAGELDLIYIAPERFRSPRFVEALRHTKIQLLAIDEAHCISEWGHDFRPDYARIGWFRERVGEPTTIALTATATPAVRDDIIKQLHLEEPRVFMAGFSRPNLRFEVASTRSNQEKDSRLLEFLRETPGSGIIYTSSRKKCESVAELVSASGRRAGVYHAGLLPEDRKHAQELFMTGKTEVVVATVAFGMGIDKADVRFVAHYNMPGSIEAYYQESGRAGRDGQPSRCLLIFTPTDRHIQEYFIENAYPPRVTVEQIYEYLSQLADDPIERTQMEIKEDLGLEIGGEGVGAALQMLHRAGGIERLEPLQNKALMRLNTDTPNVIDLLPAGAKSQRKVLSVLDRIIGQRRFEDVYFAPRGLLEATGMDLPAVNRALRELRKLECFDYVPPFRGRALRVCEPRRKFVDLEIDFDAYEERKRADYAKLDEMIAYARTRSCRQLQILRYFGDTDEQLCGNCDRCGGPAVGSSLPQPVVTERGRENLVHTIRVALAGVARTDSRVGKQMVAQMLAGSQASKITKLGLHKLSTFGMLKHLKQTEISVLLDVMLESRLIEQHEVQRYRPVVRLTDYGRDVMQENQDAPARFILPMETLRAVERHKFPTSSPVSKNSKKPTPRAFADDSPTVESPTDPSESNQSGQSRRIDDSHTDSQPSYYWTWRLLSAGFRLDEVCQIRRLDAEQILLDAEAAVERNLPLELSWVFSAEELDALEIDSAEFAEEAQPSERQMSGLAAVRQRLIMKCRRSKVGEKSPF